MNFPKLASTPHVPTCSYRTFPVLHQKEEQKTVSFDLRHDIPFRLTLEFNKENRHYTKEDIYSSYFLPAFYIIDKTNNIYLQKIKLKHILT